MPGRYSRRQGSEEQGDFSEGNEEGGGAGMSLRTLESKVNILEQRLNMLEKNLDILRRAVVLQKNQLKDVAKGGVPVQTAEGAIEYSNIDTKMIDGKIDLLEEDIGNLKMSLNDCAKKADIEKFRKLLEMVNPVEFVTHDQLVELLRKLAGKGLKRPDKLGVEEAMRELGMRKVYDDEIEGEQEEETKERNGKDAEAEKEEPPEQETESGTEGAAEEESGEELPGEQATEEEITEEEPEAGAEEEIDDTEAEEEPEPEEEIAEEPKAKQKPATKDQKLEELKSLKERIMAAVEKRKKK